MKLSKKWLDKFFDAELPDAAVLADVLTFHAFEIDGIEKVGADEVLDVKVTPNRGHDCLSHRGIAKELSAILKLPFAHDPFEHKSDISKKTDAVSVSIQEPALSKRYIAGYIKGVKVGPSPAWLKARLEAIGQRSINNVVDATNFVMFNTGQPLHAFDASKLHKGPSFVESTKDGPLYSIGVRLAREGERMVALDKKEYTLTNSMLVITAGDVPVGIAGVKGGMPAAIDESTKDIVIESANFDGVSVRKTAQALRLRTDASARFEQGLSPELAAYGMRSVVELIRKLAGGELSGFVDVYPEPQKPMFASVTVEQINNVLGTVLTGADISDVFSRLGLPYKEENGVFEVQVPPERLDLVIPEDLIEEVGRIVGYDKIPATPLPPFTGEVRINTSFYWSEKIREFLASNGFSEVYTSVFAEQGERIVQNKVDGVRPYLRESLVPGLAETLEKNIRNKELLGLSQVRLFEIGRIWKEGKEKDALGVAVERMKKADNASDFVARLQDLVGMELQPRITPQSTDTVLEIILDGISNRTATEYEQLPLSSATRFQPFSKYPYIMRDVAMWTAGASDAGGADVEEARNIITAAAGPLAVKVSLFDRFEKGGKTSLAFRLIFQSFDRTLEDAEANAAMERVYTALKEKGFEIR